MPSASPTEQSLAALAEVIGAHALETFVALLVLLLVGVALLAWSAQRVARRRRGRASHSLVRLGLGVVLGFVTIVGAAVAFAEIAEEVGEGGMFVRVDQVFMDAVHGHTPAPIVQAFDAVTRLGDPLTLALLCGVATLALLLRGERLLAFGLVAAIAGNALLNVTLKLVFERVRPLDAQGLARADGWSFPSGHTSGSLVAYGMLAYVLMRTLPRGWHLPVVLLAAATAFSVGASRIFVQAHFASDVAAGFASGMAWLAACIVSVELARGWRRRSP